MNTSFTGDLSYAGENMVRLLDLRDIYNSANMGVLKSGMSDMASEWGMQYRDEVYEAVENLKIGYEKWKMDMEAKEKGFDNYIAMVEYEEAYEKLYGVGGMDGEKLKEMLGTAEGRAKLAKILSAMGIEDVSENAVMSIISRLMETPDAYKKGVLWYDSGVWHNIIKEEKDGNTVYKLYLVPGSSVGKSKFTENNCLFATYDEKSGELLISENESNRLDILKEYGITEGNDIKIMYDKCIEYKDEILNNYNKAKGNLDSTVNKISDKTIKIEKYYSDLNNMRDEIADKNVTLTECKRQLELYNQDYNNPNIEDKTEIKNKIDELNKNITTLNTSINKLESNLSVMNAKSSDIYGMMRDRNELREKLPELLTKYNKEVDNKKLFEYENKDYLFSGKNKVPRFNTLCTWPTTEVLINYSGIDMYHNPTTGGEMTANEMVNNMYQFENLVEVNNPETLNIMANLLKVPILIGYKNPNYDTNPSKSGPGHWGTLIEGYRPWETGESFDINKMKIFETGSNEPGIKNYGNGFGGIGQENIHYYMVDTDYEKMIKLLSEMEL